MFYPRIIYPALLNHLQKDEVTVITGIRRSGKTFLLNELFAAAGAENKVLIDLENRINRELFQALDYEEILDEIARKYDLDSSKKIYLFLDEIQYLTDLPSVIKYLLDHHQIKFVVTGSSSFYLKNLFSESLSGRKQIFELYPLSFSEFLVFKGKSKNLTGKKISWNDLKKSNWRQKAHSSLFEEYLWFGGFPRVVLTNKEVEKTVLLKDVLYSYIERDVKNISGFKKITELENLIRLLPARIGQKVDIAKISREIRLSRQTVGEYLEFLEKTYMISLVSPFSNSPDREISKAQKLYFCDSGLANILGRISSGQSLENAVFNNLKIKWQPKTAFSGINYFQRKTGTEIDFILDKEIGLEVKETADTADYNQLRRLSHELGLKKHFLISRNLTTVEGTIYACQL